VASPTECGKTKFVFKLIDDVDVMMQPSSSRIVYCYGEYQKQFANYRQVEFRRDLPDFKDFNGSEPVLLVIDDLMNETNESIANFFTKGFHQKKKH